MSSPPGLKHSRQYTGGPCVGLNGTGVSLWANPEANGFWGSMALAVLPPPMVAGGKPKVVPAYFHSAARYVVFEFFIVGRKVVPGWNIKSPSHVHTLETLSSNSH